MGDFDQTFFLNYPSEMVKYRELLGRIKKFCGKEFSVVAYQNVANGMEPSAFGHERDFT